MTNPYESCSAAEHRAQSPTTVLCAVITVSDTRQLENDSSGQAIEERLVAAGHQVAHRAIVPDQPESLRQLVQQLVEQNAIDAILLTGGTGLALRDQTPETLEPLLTRRLPGFGELFRQLSFEEIGPAAMLSRASGGLIDSTLVLMMPGSTAAVRLAMDRLILPELTHLVSHSRR